MDHKYKILVAEDEEIILKSIIRKIEALKLPYKVIASASNGIEAMALIEKHIPDVVITDIKMPGMDGLEMLRQINFNYPFINFIIISGYSDFDYTKKAIRAQVYDYLLKPLKQVELSDTLSRLLIQLNANMKSYEIPVLTTEIEEKIELVKLYITENFMNDINVNSIARVFNYSPTYLSRIFMKRENMPLSKFIINIRICEAKHLLGISSSLVKKIGEMVGYTDQYHFSKIFKAVTGTTPNEFRDGL